jgi:glycerol transport system ATP-binding protein
VLQQATPEALFDEPAHTYVGYFIGSPGMNVLPCRIDGGAAVIAGQPVPLPEELAGKAAGRAGSLELGIRPEHVVLNPPTGGVPAALGAIEDHGRFRIATATIGELKLKLKLGPGAPIAGGEACRLGLPPERIRLYEGGRRIS